MKKKLQHWMPTAYCFALSCICVVTFIIRSSSLWMIPLLAFLPMCFFFAANVTSRMDREIRDLREQVAKLQEKPVNPHDAARV